MAARRAKSKIRRGLRDRNSEAVTESTNFSGIISSPEDPILRSERFGQLLRTTDRAVGQRFGRSRFTSVVFLADPSATWGLIPDRSVIDSMVADRRLNSLSLQPWHRAALNSWLGDCSIGSNALDEEKKIAETTGRWPFLLEEFRSLTVTGNMSWQAALATLRTQLNDPVARTTYMETFGLKKDAPLKILKAIVALGGSADQEVLLGIVEGVSKPEIEAAFYWADRLNLIQPGPQTGEWVVDPVVQELLRDRTDDGLVDNPGAA